MVSFTPLPFYPRGKSPWFTLVRRLGRPSSSHQDNGREKCLARVRNWTPGPSNSWHVTILTVLFRLKCIKYWRINMLFNETYCDISEITAFCDVTMWILVHVYEPPKRQYTSTRLRGVTSQMIAVLVATVRAEFVHVLYVLKLLLRACSSSKFIKMTTFRKLIAFLSVGEHSGKQTLLWWYINFSRMTISCTYHLVIELAVMTLVQFLISITLNNTSRNLVFYAILKPIILSFFV
jgi:hypothetical protein